ncbi:MMPL family transporter [Agromyces kandeliae]|uniref:MMPL family transporter n=1 Tax=Agromyces kandeliae TaxID=2666141 RepID=A0A6L5R558_9MICO|nr:MMPL family transporter [Agromyces kandeliae]MRX44714.1 MMPL family transporter [Agromyces kandeliae]
MAELLYRLGRFSSRRSWTVITGWIVALALAAGAFLAFGGTLTTSMSIPGTETDRVNAQLADELDGLGGAAGTVVFQADGGSAFTDAQQEQIGEVLDDLAAIDRVDDVVNPFDAASDRADQEQQLADGVIQLDDAEQRIADGTAQLDAAEAQLDAGRARLDAAIAQAQADGTYAFAEEQFSAQQAELDQNRAQLDAQRAELDAGAAELPDRRAQLDAGQRLVDAASEIRTVSTDGATATGVVMFEDDLFTLPAETKAAVAETLDAADIDGVQVDYSSEIAASTDGLLGPGEIAGVVLALLVLIIMFRALLPAVLPIISSIVGVGVGVAGSLAFSGLIDMSSVTPVLGVMLGLAVGIDYALFIMNRHRSQVLAGMEIRESIALANGTSGNAVVFAGSTVLVALLALNITGIPFLGVMGTVGAACVLIAVLLAVSFTPAVLGLIGIRIVNRRARAQIGHEAHARPELTPMTTGRALLRAALAIVVLLVVAIPALSMRLGLPDGSSEATDSTQYRAYTAVADAFGAGQNGPLLVTAALPAGVAEDAVVATQADLAELLLQQEDVVAVAPVGVSDDRDFIAFQVVPVDGPSSVSTEQLVHDLRDLSPLSADAAGGIAGVDGDIDLGVAGQASGNIDISEKLAGVLPTYLALVVGLSLIILVLVFRSILVPLVATAGFVLSLFAAFGAMVAIFQWGWLGSVFGVHDPGPVLNFAPIIIMGVLFGLAMDYQLFLVSGMREAYVHGVPARTAVVAGLRNGRVVVTAAAIIMTAVFGGFVFSHLTMVRPLGFGLAIGVLFDAFIVRMLLIPAVMHLLGNSAWRLPKWLDRILPNVDVEGAALERSHPVHGSSATAGDAAGDAVAGAPAESAEDERQPVG